MNWCLLVEESKASSIETDQQDASLSYIHPGFIPGLAQNQPNPANIYNSSDCSTYIACGSKNLFLHMERNSILFNSLICYYMLLHKFYFNIMQLLWLHFYNWCSTPEENFLKSKKCYLGAESENLPRTLWVAVLRYKASQQRCCRCWRIQTTRSMTLINGSCNII